MTSSDSAACCVLKSDRSNSACIADAGPSTDDAHTNLSIDEGSRLRSTLIVEFVMIWKPTTCRKSHHITNYPSRHRFMLKRRLERDSRSHQHWIIHICAFAECRRSTGSFQTVAPGCTSYHAHILAKNQWQRPPKREIPIANKNSREQQAARIRTRVRTCCTPD